MENQPKVPQSLTLDLYALDHLKQTVKWTKFLAITGFACLGLMLIVFAFLFVISKSAEIPLTFMSVLPMIILGVIYFFPLYYLLKFSKLSKQAIDNMDSEALTLALAYQKMLYRFMGIMMICVFVLYAIIGVMALVFFRNGFG